MCNFFSDVKIFSFPTFLESNGQLTVIEGSKVNFNIKRIFYVYGVWNKKRRGKHSHYKTDQVLCCLQGKVTTIINDGNNDEVYLLDDPTKAIYIPSGIWDEQIYHTPDTILLVLANTDYDKSDYITDWKEFINWRSSIKKS